jgi:hypothetical protein
VSTRGTEVFFGEFVVNVLGDQSRDGYGDLAPTFKDSGQLGHSQPFILNVFDNFRTDDLVKSSIRKRKSQGIALQEQKSPLGFLAFPHLPQNITGFEQAPVV